MAKPKRLTDISEAHWCPLNPRGSMQNAGDEPVKRRSKNHQPSAAALETEPKADTGT